EARVLDLQAGREQVLDDDVSCAGGRFNGDLDADELSAAQRHPAQRPAVLVEVPPAHLHRVVLVWRRGDGDASVDPGDVGGAAGGAGYVDFVGAAVGRGVGMDEHRVVRR